MSDTRQKAGGRKAAASVKTIRATRSTEAAKASKPGKSAKVAQTTNATEIHRTTGSSARTGSRRPTKAASVLALLRSKRGATIEEMARATGWQAHSVRGFLSGTVKKRLGLVVESETDKSGVRRYRIAGDADEGDDRNADIRYMTPAE